MSGAPAKTLISWAHAVAPALLLAVAVLAARISGNDKAPYLVLAALVVGTLMCVVICGVVLVRERHTPGAWLKCATAALPWAYVAAAILLARARWVDLNDLLGFR